MGTTTNFTVEPEDCPPPVIKKRWIPIEVGLGISDDRRPLVKTAWTVNDSLKLELIGTYKEGELTEGEYLGGGRFASHRTHGSASIFGVATWTLP